MIPSDTLLSVISDSKYLLSALLTKGSPSLLSRKWIFQVVDLGEKSQNLAFNTKSLVNRIFKLILRDRLGIILASKRSAGVAPEVNLTESVTHTPPPSTNKAAHYGFEIQRRCQQEVQNRSISGPTESTYVLQKICKKLIQINILVFYQFCWIQGRRWKFDSI